MRVDRRDLNQSKSIVDMILLLRERVRSGVAFNDREEPTCSTVMILSSLVFASFNVLELDSLQILPNERDFVFINRRNVFWDPVDSSCPNLFRRSSMILTLLTVVLSFLRFLSVMKTNTPMRTRHKNPIVAMDMIHSFESDMTI